MADWIFYILVAALFSLLAISIWRLLIGWRFLRPSVGREQQTQ
jgi:hypothetical protein